MIPDNSRHFARLQKPSLGLGMGLGLSGNGGVSVPALDLDFVNRSTLDSRITFTRASSATYVNSSGLIASAATDAPRFGYDPVALTARGLLIEGQRTNLLLQSEDFNTTWTKASLTGVTTNAVAAPDGATTADKVIPNATLGRHYIQQTISSQAAPWTFTIFAKAAGYDRFLFTCGGTNWVGFNLTSGTVESSLGTGITQASIEDYGNGWYRCTVSSTTTATGTLILTEVFNASYTNGNTTPSWAGNTTDGIYLWGAQLEAGGDRTSYIPTTTAQVTRSADICTMSGAAFSNFFNAPEGVFVAGYYSNNLTVGSSKAVFSANDNSANWIKAYINTSRGVRGNVRTGGSDVADISSGTQTDAANGKVAFAYKANDFAASLNGAAAVTDTAGALPAPDRLSIGYCTVQSIYLNGWVRSLRYYRTRLPDATLASLSA